MSQMKNPNVNQPLGNQTITINIKCVNSQSGPARLAYNEYKTTSYKPVVVKVPKKCEITVFKFESEQYL